MYYIQFTYTTYIICYFRIIPLYFEKTFVSNEVIVDNISISKYSPYASIL